MSNKKTDNAMRNLFIEKIYNICDGKKAEEVFFAYIKSDGAEGNIGGKMYEKNSKFFSYCLCIYFYVSGEICSCNRGRSLYKRGVSLYG